MLELTDKQIQAMLDKEEYYQSAPASHLVGVGVLDKTDIRCVSKRSKECAPAQKG